MKKAKQRQLVLPRPPKGYPTMPAHLSESAAHYERMWVSGDGDDEYDVAKLQYDCFNQLSKDEKMLAHWEISGVQRWVSQGFRTIYPTPEIVEACKHTDVMSSVMGNDIQISVPSFLLVMPNGCGWVNEFGIKASHVVVNLREEESVITKFCEGVSVEMPMPSPRYLTVTVFWDDFASQSSCIPFEDNEKTLGEIINKYTTNTEHHISSRMDALLSEEQMEGDRKVAHDIDVFIANALLIMQSYPEYLTTTTHRARGLDTKKMTRKVKVSMFATPSNLRQKVSYTPKENKKSNGTRTVKMHMRKGHWRRQRHNSQWEVDNPEVKVVVMPDSGHAHMTWIRPVMVEGNQK